MKYGISIKRIIINAGAVIAFAIGSGFATGQEILQFFSSFGSQIFLCAIMFFIVNLYMNYNFLEAGRIGQFERGSQVFNYFCGKYVGAFFDWFAVLFSFLSYFVMIAGAGATLEQQFGLPPVVGAAIIAVLACVTVMFGLNKLVDIIGTIGPIIIIMCLIAGIVGIVNGDMTIAQADAAIPTLNVPAAADNWFMSMVSYLGFGMLWFAPFLSQIGKKEKVSRNAQFGVIAGMAILTLAILLVGIALIKNISLTALSQVPLLAVLQKFSPVLATIFSVVIFAGIYTTACPLLWTPCDRLAKEGTTKYKIITVVLAVAGCAIGLFAPYSKIVNIVYAVNGKVGFVLLAFIIYKNIAMLVKKFKKA